MPSVSERKTSSMRSGSVPGSAWSCWFSSRARVGGAQAVAQHDLLDTQDPLEHRDVDARARRMPSAPQCIQRSVPSRRSRAGENWNALSLRIGSDEELQALALLGTGHRHDRVAGILVGLVVARDRLAADVLRGERRAVAPLLEQDRRRHGGSAPTIRRP